MNKTKNLNIDWKLFYKSVFALVIPMALQNLINVGVTATDVIMLGKVGEKVLSGASLAGQVQFIMTLIFYGTTSGATVLTAQYWGKKDTRTIEKILGIGLRTGLTTAVVFAVAALGIPGLLMRIYTSDPVVIAEGVKYLRIVALSYIFMAVTQVYLNIIRSMEKVVIATFIYAVSLGLNIIINAVLIFGMFGFPKLGIAGAAIGTLCARGAETIMVLFYAFLKNKIVRIRLQDMLHIDPVLWKDFLVYALPVVLNELMWGLGSSANTAVIGHLGSAAVAANSVAQVARQLATVVAFGISNAAAIYLGKTIGEKKMEHAKAYAVRFIWLSLLLGGLGGLVYITAGVSEWKFENGVAGFGFLALAVMIFGQWKPVNIGLAALLFGLFRALSNVYTGFDALVALKLPSTLYNMFPYIISLIVLVFVSKNSRAPKAEGIPYDKGQR